MADAANYKQVQRQYEALPAAVRNYFDSFPGLLTDYPWEVSVAYVFSRIEYLKNQTIYCGLLRLHHTEREVTRRLIDRDHMTRGRFRELFEIVFDKPLNKPLLAKLSEAESLRDKTMHGKPWTAAEARKALSDIFEFVCEFDDLVHELAGFHPVGDLRGFKGRGKALSKETTRWVLKGMGIPKGLSAAEA